MTVRHLFGERVPMRDGVTLAADVWLPPGGGSAPSILMRTPYGKQALYYTPPARYLAERGYAVCVQDVRGRYDSEGEFYPFFNNEGPDGRDTIDWVAAQPWSNGRVGMMGGSYAGWVQWCAAAHEPPALVTFVSSSSATRWMQQVPFHNGVPTLGALPWLFGLSARSGQNPSLVDWARVYRHLPLRTCDEELGRELPVWREWLARPRLDDWWQSRRLSPADFAKVAQPVLHVTSTYDGTQPGELYVWEGSLEHSPAPERHFLLFGPWDHLGAASSMQKQVLGGVDFGPDAVVDVDELHLRWFDRFLREDGEPAEWAPRARVFYTGLDRWFDEPAWPPPGEAARFHLASGGRANSAAGDGRLAREAGSGPADSFLYDPLEPVADVPDLAVYSSMDPLEPVDPPLVRDFVEARDDVLVYTSEPLAEPLAVAGQPLVELYGSSDAPDTDWHAWLADVDPAGRSLTLVRGELAARFRDSLAEEALLEPGRVYRFAFELLSLAHVFRPGHRLRLVVASSNFPIYARNQNTGRPYGEDAEVRVARNTVHHDEEHPSCVILPLVPDPEGRP